MSAPTCRSALRCPCKPAKRPFRGKNAANKAQPVSRCAATSTQRSGTQHRNAAATAVPWPCQGSAKWASGCGQNVGEQLDNLRHWRRRGRASLQVEAGDNGSCAATQESSLADASAPDATLRRGDIGGAAPEENEQAADDAQEEQEGDGPLGKGVSRIRRAHKDPYVMTAVRTLQNVATVFGSFAGRAPEVQLEMKYEDGMYSAWMSLPRLLWVSNPRDPGRTKEVELGLQCSGRKQTPMDAAREVLNRMMRSLYTKEVKLVMPSKRMPGFAVSTHVSPVMQIPGPHGADTITLATNLRVEQVYNLPAQYWGGRTVLIYTPSALEQMVQHLVALRDEWDTNWTTRVLGLSMEYDVVRNPIGQRILRPAVLSIAAPDVVFVVQLLQIRGAQDLLDLFFSNSGFQKCHMGQKDIAERLSAWGYRQLSAFVDVWPQTMRLFRSPGLYCAGGAIMHVCAPPPLNVKEHDWEKSLLSDRLIKHTATSAWATRIVSLALSPLVPFLARFRRAILPPVATDGAAPPDSGIDLEKLSNTNFRGEAFVLAAMDVIQQVMRRFWADMGPLDADVDMLPYIDLETGYDAGTGYSASISLPKLVWVPDAEYPGAQNSMQLEESVEGRGSPQDAVCALLANVLEIWSDPKVGLLTPSRKSPSGFRITATLSAVLRLWRPRLDSQPTFVPLDITKEQVEKLPVSQWRQGDGVVIVDSPAGLEAALGFFSELKERWTEDWTTRILGMNVQPLGKKRRHSKLGVLTLATEDVVYFIMLLRIQRAALMLEPLLNDDGFLKCSFSGQADAEALAKYGFNTRGHVDLQPVAKRLLAYPELPGLAGAVLGARVPRPNKALNANWIAPKLSGSQIAFAATDAWVCRESSLWLGPMIPQIQKLYRQMTPAQLQAEVGDGPARL